MPSVEKKLISIPFQHGLNQIEDPRYLDPGALITATNVVRVKRGVLQKRHGLAWLATQGQAPGPEQSTQVSIVTGRRLSRYKGALLAIGQDQNVANGAQWGDALWQYQEAGNLPMFVDRMPEVHKLPDQQLAGGDTVIVDMDHVICSNYRVSVWLANNWGNYNLAGTNAYIQYCVTDARTREVVIPPQNITALHTFAESFGLRGPKLAACGTTAVLMFQVQDGNGDYYAMSLDCTQPWTGWTLSSILTTGLTCVSGAIYDMCAVVGDTTQWSFVVAAAAVDSTFQVVLFRCNVAALTVTQQSAITVTPYDNVSPISSFGLRADSVAGETGVAMSWRTGGTTTHVSMQIQQWPNISVQTAGAVDLLTTPGPISTIDPTPKNIAIERIDALNASKGYKILWSPSNSQWNGLSPPNTSGLPGAFSTAYIASYIAVKSGANMIVAANQPRVTFGACLASHIVKANNIGYVVSYLPSYTQGTYFVLADDAWSDTSTLNITSAPPLVATYFPMRHCATMAPRIAGAMFLVGGGLPQVLPRWWSNPVLKDAGAGYETLLPVSIAPTLATPCIFTLDFNAPTAYQPAEIDGLSMFAGGAPSATDGTRVFELGYPYYPIIIGFTAVGTGGSLSNGTYSYIAIYEWRDSAGNVHRSARSVPGTITLAGGTTTQQVQVKVGVLGYTGREKAIGAFWQGSSVGPQGYINVQNPVIVRLYRTKAGGSIYYNVDPSDNVSSNAVVGQANHQGCDPGGAAGQMVITDFQTADAQLSTHALLYGDGSDGTQPGNVLDDLCPPGLQTMVVHNNRVFGADGSTVWATKAFTEGIGPAFNEAFAFTVDDGSGPITALASLDANLVIFKRDRLFVMSGDGPTDNGGQNNWQPPQRVASDSGCFDWRSVVSWSKGVYFMGDAGRRLLTRDLQVVPVTDVIDSDTTFPAVSSALVHPSQDRILWTQNAGDTANAGIATDYDYAIDMWTTRQTQWSQTQSAFVSAVITNVVGNTLPPTYHVLRSDGTIGRESQLSYLDGTSYVPMTIDTAWLKAEGIEGFARFRRLLVTWINNDPHQLNVYVQYDYDQSGNWTLMGTITAAQQAAMVTNLAQERFQLPRQRAMAVRFRIQDAADSLQAAVSGQGPTIVSLGLEVGVYTNRRLGRMPPAQVR